MTNLELIAKLAGVSRGTVDRVLHNRGQVRPETEEKVQAVMQELDFQPNALGRAFYLSRKKNKIGILVAFREPDFQKQVMQGVNEGVVYARQHGVEVLVEYAHPDDTEGYLASLRRLLDGGVRGLAIRGVLSDEIDRCLREISREQMQIVVYNEDIRDKSLRDCFVGQDSCRAGLLPGRRLRRLSDGTDRGTGRRNAARGRRRSARFERGTPEWICGVLP